MLAQLQPALLAVPLPLAVLTGLRPAAGHAVLAALPVLAEHGGPALATRGLLAPVLAQARPAALLAVRKELAVRAVLGLGDLSAALRAPAAFDPVLTDRLPAAQRAPAFLAAVLADLAPAARHAVLAALPVLAEHLPAARLAVVLLLSVHAERGPPALLAVAFPLPVLAVHCAPALLAPHLELPVLAQLRQPALLPDHAPRVSCRHRVGTHASRKSHTWCQSTRSQDL
eukprot:3941228-Rhodomonas_salina.2